MNNLPEDRYIEIGGLNTRYWALGDKGKPVLLIHGLAVSAEIWVHNVGDLAKEHRVYIPDLPGFGRADAPGPSFSPFDYTPFLDAFMNSLGIGKVSLLGQSLGGGIALHYTLNHADRVEKLVLVGSAGFGKEVIWTLRWASLPWIGELFVRPSRRGVELVFKLAVRNPALITKDFVELYYRLFSRPGFKEFFLRLLRQIVNFRGGREEILAPIRNNLSKIIQPVLIVWGKDDRVLPVNGAYTAIQSLPNARLEIFEGCGHIPFFERSEKFNQLVLEFLASREIGPTSFGSQKQP